MATNPKLTENDLTEDELRAIVGQIREVLWPNRNPNQEWTPETVEEVSQVLVSYNLEP